MQFLIVNLKKNYFENNNEYNYETFFAKEDDKKDLKKLLKLIQLNLII